MNKLEVIGNLTKDPETRTVNGIYNGPHVKTTSKK